MPKTIVIGSGGRLGAALAREWRAAGEEVAGFTHAQLDLADDARLRTTLAPLDFDVLVNCAALTNVDHCETHADEAFRINADAARTLAEIAAGKGARCVHVSTDYVFDGAGNEPLTEADEARPISVYGASKRAGEIAVLGASERHLVVRVSWVFGPDRPSFVDQILQRALTHETVEAVGDKWASPTYTLDAATLLLPLLRDERAAGLLHLCNTGACTWQEYGQHALDCAAAAGVELKARTVGAVRMADLKAFIAKRPPFTAMNPAKLAALVGHTPQTWQQAVESHVRRQHAAG